MTEQAWQICFAILFVANVAVRWVAHWRAGIFVRKDAAGHEGRNHDHAKQAIIAVSLLTSLAYSISPALVSWGQIPMPEAARFAGLMSATIATPVHIWAFVALGTFYNSVLVVRDDHQLVDRGPYRYIRHPMYASALLGGLSLALISANAVLLATFALSLWLVLCSRIPREERMLREHLGDRYDDYTQRTGALLPRLRRRPPT